MGLCIYNLGNVPKKPLDKETGERIEQLEAKASEAERKRDRSAGKDPAPCGEGA